jgi:ankyrin repeat protein
LGELETRIDFIALGAFLRHSRRMLDPAAPFTATTRPSEQMPRPSPRSRWWVALVQLPMRRRASVVLAAVALGGLVACDIHYAARHGNRDRVERMLKANPNLVTSKTFDGSTPLHEAAANGDKPVAEMLLRYHAQVNAKGGHARTAMHLAALGGSDEVVTLLLAHHATVNAEDDQALTPLHLAAMNDHPETVKLLLAHKAEINAKDKHARTPLHWAAVGGGSEVTKLLLAGKAEVNVRDDHGLTPLHLAAENGRIGVAEALLGRQAEVKHTPNSANQSAPAGEEPASDRARLPAASSSPEADVNAKDDRGFTPLHLATMKGHKDIAEFLRQCGGQE